MISLKRYGSAVAAAAALVSIGMAAAPAATAGTTAGPRPVAAHKAGEGPVGSRQCVVLTALLNAHLQAAATALAANDVATATTEVAAAQAIVAQLQAAHCLPPSYTVLTTQLNHNLQDLHVILTDDDVDVDDADSTVHVLLGTSAKLAVHA